MSAEGSKKSVVKQIVVIAAGVVIGLAAVKLGEMGIKKLIKA